MSYLEEFSNSKELELCCFRAEDGLKITAYKMIQIFELMNIIHPIVVRLRSRIIVSPG